MEAVFELEGEFARVDEVCAAEGVAVVEHVVIVGEVGRGEAGRPVFAEGFSDGKIGSRVGREMLRAVAIDEARAVVDVDSRPDAFREIDVEAGAYGVALIVIEEEILIDGRREVGEAASDSAEAFGVLVREGEVELGAIKNARGGRGGFPALDAGAVDGEREEDVGVAENVVIEEILRGGAKVGDVEGPALEWDGQTELTLLVAFAVEGEKATRRGRALIEDWTRDGEEGWGLIVVSPESASDPVEFRNLERSTEARVGRILADGLIAPDERVRA